MKNKKIFWVLEYSAYTGGYDGGYYIEKHIFWGTWLEAAREVIKNYDSPCFAKGDRSVRPFELPEIKNKRKSFYVL